jgi:sulfopyruvate decarboxylase TPP-binding subunit
MANSWQDELYECLREGGVETFSYVPDAGHKILIERSLADPDANAIPLTSEQEGVALAIGCHLGGTKSTLLMQSSGLGNCVNYLSLIQGGGFPFLTLISMRGEFGEGNPWQVPMGRAVQPVFEAMGGSCLVVERPDDVIGTAEAAMTMVFQSGQSVALLLSQKLIGAKAF